MDPGHSIAHFFIGLAYARLGRLSEAIDAFSTARSLAPGFRHALALLGYAHAKANQHDKAIERLGELQALAAQGYVPAFCFAVSAHGFDEPDRTIECLEKTYEERDWTACLLGIDPFWDDLRQHPGFVNLVRRMNFPSVSSEPGC